MPPSSRSASPSSVNLRTRSFLLAALLALPLAGRAATTCTVASTTLAFGPYDVFNGSPLDTQADVNVTCTRNGGPPGTTVTLALGPSTTSGAIATRRLKRAGGADLLDYNLYRDATRLGVWGQTSGVDTVAQSVSVPNKASANLSFTLFGRIPAGQDPSVGSYSDSLLVTISF
jgi:spore coat protein U domain-containing protein, fimbrial subunit CupE1/2/3/6